MTVTPSRLHLPVQKLPASVTSSEESSKFWTEKKLHKALRALKMAGRADTYLNYHLFFHLLFYFLFEKLVHRSGTYRKEFVSTVTQTPS